MAYASEATNLVAGDTNHVVDLFIYDQIARRTERVTVNTLGAQANRGGASRVLGLSVDGRYVLFASDASNLVASDTNGAVDVFVRNREAGRTVRVNVSTSGAQANNGGPTLGGISGDGRYVVFSSAATNLTGDDRSPDQDVFVRDVQVGSTRLVSRSLSGATEPAISGGGRYIAYRASNAGRYDIYLYDQVSGSTELVSRGLRGAASNGDSGLPVLSRDGRFVAFVSSASNLVDGVTNGVRDTFAWDRLTRTIHRISVSGVGGQANGASTAPAISPSAEYIAFVSDATNLVGSDTNHVRDVFVRYPELAEE